MNMQRVTVWYASLFAVVVGVVLAGRAAAQQGVGDRFDRLDQHCRVRAAG